jgi:hypothetical protein
MILKVIDRIALLIVGFLVADGLGNLLNNLYWKIYD